MLKKTKMNSNKFPLKNRPAYIFLNPRMTKSLNFSLSKKKMNMKMERGKMIRSWVNLVD